MFSFLEHFWTALTTYPEIFSGVVGMVVPIGLAEVARAVYFPPDWNRRDQWKAILPFDLILAYAITHTLWHFLDHDNDPTGLLAIGSVCFSIGCLVIHVFGIRVILHKWPWIANGD